MANGYRDWNYSCGSTSAELLIKYVRDHSWWAVANIFNDNGYSIQPHTANGYICLSETTGAIYTTGKVDAENSPVLENRFLVTPPNQVSFQQTISVFPLEMVQRFDCLLFTQIHHYEFNGPAEEFPVPTIPKKADVMAMEKDENGLYPDATHIVGLMDTKGLVDSYEEYIDRRNRGIEPTGTVESALNLYPDKPEWDIPAKFVGMRIEAYREFQENQRIFCEAMNRLFGLSDCE